MISSPFLLAITVRDLKEIYSYPFGTKSYWLYPKNMEPQKYFFLKLKKKVLSRVHAKDSNVFCGRVRHVAVAKADAVDVGDLLCLIEEGEEPIDPTRSLDPMD